MNFYGTFLVLWIIMSHWVADLVLQTHWQASNKSKNWTALLRHVGVYTLTMTVLLFWMIRRPDVPVAVNLAWFAGVTFVAHFATDAATSRLNSMLFMAEFQQIVDSGGTRRIAMKPDFNPHYFFVAVGFDQCLHYAQILLTLTVLAEWPRP